MQSNRVAERISPEALEGLPDGELVRLVQQGERDAYATLFRRYYRKMFGMAYSRLRSREDAEDVVQEAFVKVFRYIRSFKGDSSFYTWLYHFYHGVRHLYCHLFWITTCLWKSRNRNRALPLSWT